MGADDPNEPFDGCRDYPRVLLVCVCLLALVLASTALPVLSPPGVHSPAAAAIPVPQPDDAQGGTGESEVVRRMGALSPGPTTTVGGTLGGRTPLRSLSTDVHFVATAPSQTYWRTAAYDRYTGDGWQRPEGGQPVDGELSIVGRRGNEFRYSVTMKHAATTVPSPWRPWHLDLANVTVAPGSVLRANPLLLPGTTYAGVADRQPDDPALLRSAGRDYPAEIEDRYTRLPDDTAAALAPVADRVTENASTPYETVRAIESWLETEKAYSLNATHPSGADPATAFVESMDEGYCEYFATGMVAMVRTQDVPARYVVGYSTGQQRDDTTYVVRGLNAHAWVEVYFPEVGWVPFDPTPASERVARERAAVESAGGGPYRPTPTPTPSAPPSPTAPTSPTPSTPTTPTQAPTPGGDEGTDRPTDEPPTPTPTPPGSDDESPDQSTDGAGQYDVALNRTAVPGATVLVTVTRDGAPVADVAVLFNEERIGETDANGTVVGAVPYAETLTIDVRDGVGDGPDGAFTRLGGPPPVGDRFFAVGSLFAVDSHARDVQTIPLETEASLAISGDVATGEVVAVTAAVADVPVREATVTLDGRTVATTDRTGTADVTLPADPGTVEIVVTRGAVTGNRTLSLSALNLSAEPTTPLPVAWGGARLTATLGTEPIPGAVVRVDGERVATTGPDGRATVTLPPSMAVQLSVERYGQVASTTLANPLVNVGLVGFLTLGIVGVSTVAVRRRESHRHLPHVGWRIVDWILGALVGIAGVLDAGLGSLRTGCVAAAVAVFDVATRRRTARSVLTTLAHWGRTRRDRLLARAPLAERAARTPAETGDRGRVREGWRALVEATGVESDALTPGEIAHRAIDRAGLPERPVALLRDAYRAVEYGGRDPADHVARVEEAVVSIESVLDARDASAGDAHSRGDDAATGREGTE